mmetsp:Transcript_5359/g.10103  ORF Transcript_5359/g.10103 Transcript_5359/m.10103 type:complete len:221 (+) Transcript_5359:64-726(+)
MPQVPCSVSRSTSRSPHSVSPNLALRRQSLHAENAYRSSTPPPPRTASWRITTRASNLKVAPGMGLAEVNDHAAVPASLTSDIVKTRVATPRYGPSLSSGTAGPSLSAGTARASKLVKPRAGTRLEPVMSGSSSEEEGRDRGGDARAELRAAQLRTLGFSASQLAALVPQSTYDMEEQPQVTAVPTPAFVEEPLGDSIPGSNSVGPSPTLLQSVKRCRLD